MHRRKRVANAESSGRPASATTDDNEPGHDQLAEQMLHLVTSMKQNFSKAGSVIREDNANLNVMQNQALSNRENLSREGKRLEHHAYRSCFDCIVLLTVVLVIWSFLATVIFIKFFPKHA